MAGSTDSKSYALAMVDATFAGIDLKRGCGEGDWIKIKYEQPDAVAKIGADGEGAVATTASQLGTVEIHVLQTSQVNDDLSRVRRQGRSREQGVVIGEFECRDRSGALAATGPDAFISECTEAARGKEITENVWKLTVLHLDLDPGGNPSVAAG